MFTTNTQSKQGRMRGTKFVSGLQTKSDQSIRGLLRLDAFVCAASAALLLGAANPLGRLFNLSPEFLRWTGASLVPFVLLLGFASVQANISRRAVLAIAGLNLVWVTGSLGLLFSGWVQPSSAGYAFVIAQAVLVATFAELQIRAARSQ
jgi:hypothetical protein